MGAIGSDFGLTLVVIAGLLLAFLAPLAVRRFGPVAFLGLALYPAAVFAFFATNPTAAWSVPWIPEMGIEFGLKLDGLSRIFALLISGLGALILIYCAGYFTPKPNMGRFAGAFVGFMAAMLGLVLSADAITMFVFWELTSITSFLLIGFYHRDEESRTSAAQALLITGLGGLAMLAGLVLLGSAQGTFRFDQMAPLAAHSAVAVPALLLIFAGCATKSAQFPFHFWLPNAMAAPTPVSAFLHSATMVKAGVFLLARIRPVFDEVPLWTPLLSGFGAATVLAALACMLFHRDLKKLLAYSTVGALGILVFLLGQPGETALKTFVLLLAAHALYKGALFLIAGILDHETGSRDAFSLGGLRRQMPWTAAASALTLGSALGLAPFLGFWGKEYAILAAAAPLTWFALLIFVLASAIAAVRVALIPFFVGAATHPDAHEAPWAMRWGPLTLAFGGLAGGLALGQAGPALLTPMGAAIAGAPLSWSWSPVPHLNAAFAVGLGFLAASLTAGFAFRPLELPNVPTLDQLWRTAWQALPRAAAWPTRLSHPKKLRSSLGLFFALITLCAVWPMLRFGGLTFEAPADAPKLHELVITGLAVAAAVAALFAKSRLAAICMLGISGTSIAILFLAFGAPDLALTQLLTELLTIVIAVLVFHKLPQFRKLSGGLNRVSDAMIAVAFGLAMGILAFAIQAVDHETLAANYYAANSVEKAYGRNVVNTILVDFRAMDTMGEITVLAIAALGVYALVRLRHPKEEEA